MEYVNLLTESELKTAFAVGVELKAAEFGVSEKSASGYGFFSDAATAFSKLGKLTTLVSVAIGVPIGIGAHWATETANTQTAKERELFEKAKLYRQTASELDRRLVR